MTQWIYNNNPFSPDDIGENMGFVYMITNLTNGKKYIGKKNFFKTLKKYHLTSKKKKTRIVSSDWETYTGSSRELNDDIAKGDEIRKDILKLCKSKSGMTYIELKYQMEADALFKEDYYNKIINIRISSNCVKNINIDMQDANI